jgi:hypothetical protein
MLRKTTRDSAMQLCNKQYLGEHRLAQTLFREEPKANKTAQTNAAHSNLGTLQPPTFSAL